MKKFWLYVVAVVFAYTLFDIVIWAGFFEPNEAYLNVLANWVPVYHICLWLWLIALAWYGALLIGDYILSPMFFVGAIALAHSGLEDILYYWLRLRPVPQMLPWLNDAPLVIGAGVVTRNDLIVSSCIWLISFYTLHQVVLIIRHE